MIEKERQIAVIGMGCIFPGAADLESFWHNLVEGRTFFTPHPDPRAEAMKDRGEIANTHGGYLNELARFDPLAFNILPNTVRDGDPSHFLGLAAADMAVRDAGMADALDPERTRVVVGYSSQINSAAVKWMQHGFILDQTMDILEKLDRFSPGEPDRIRDLLKQGLPPMALDSMNGLISNAIPNRICRHFNITGGGLVVDASCSSGMAAVETGISDLAADRCDLVIAGSVQGSVPPDILQLFHRLETLGSGNTLPVFDRRADGALFGEGAGFLVLMEKQAARKAGRRIYGLIREIGVSASSGEIGLMTPDYANQKLALTRAYRRSGVDPASIGLLEAHGTGIPLVDKVEFRIFRSVFPKTGAGEPDCALGSVKSMIGHCLSASAASGLIKALLSLYHAVIPPTLNCDDPVPGLIGKDTRFYLNSMARPWIHTHPHLPRRAAVNSMGFGGANAHCILEAYRGDRP